MTARRRAVELSPPPGMDPGSVMAVLAEHLDLAPSRPSSTDVVYLDTFDGRLHGDDLVLHRSRADRDGQVRLTLVEPGAPDRSGTVDAAVTTRSPDRLLGADLPGPIGSRLADVIENRALLPIARVSSRRLAAAVLDRERKTVVRLTAETPVAHARGRAPVPLADRIRVQPVLGYDRDHERVVAALDDLGLRPAAGTIVDDAVTATGGRPGGVSTKVAVPLTATTRSDIAAVSICRRLADMVDANLPGTIDDLDPEFLHDLRVAIRRTRSVLKELKGVLPKDDEERSRADLRWIQEITGPTRDIDVELAGWPALVAALPAAPAADLEPLRLLMGEHRAAEFARMRRTLRGTRFRTAWAAWRATLDRPLPLADEGRDEDEDGDGDSAGVNRVPPAAALPIGETAGARIAAVYRDMVRLGRSIDDDSPSEDLHDLRKRGKELRYLLELFGQLWPDDVVGPMVATLKALQDVLGRFQDDQVEATYLRAWGPELVGQPGGTDSLIALGLVIDRLATDQADARAHFAERFAPFAAKDRRRDVKATFAAAGRTRGKQ
jgi:CHAD domain-containing protein